MPRGRALALVSGDRGVGVDTVRVGFEAERRVLPADGDWTQGRRERGAEAVKRFRRLPGYGVFESWDAPVGSRARMWVEASLPKRVTWDGFRGRNVDPVPLTSAAVVGSGMVAELVALGWVADVGDVQVNRVDVVRDFDGVEGLGELLAGLRGSSCGVGALRLHQASWEGERKGVATLSYGNRSHQATLYDKSAEARLSEAGHLRYEYRCRVPALRRGGVVGFADLPGTLGLARSVFEALGWGAAMVGQDELREAVMRSELSWRGKPVTATVRLGLLSYVGCVSAGVEPGVSRSTAWKYRHLARQLGLVVEDGGAESASGDAEGAGRSTARGSGGSSVGSPIALRGRRLDWARGTVVAA